MRLAAGAALLAASLLNAGSALANAAPPPELAWKWSVEELLTGGWRFQADGKMPPPCEQPAAAGSGLLVFEFDYTLGRLRWLRPDGTDMIVNATLDVEQPDHARLTTADGASFDFYIDGIDDGVIEGHDMPGFAAELQGKYMRKCAAPQDRSRIVVEDYRIRAKPMDMAPIAYLSQGGNWAPPYFVDMRFADDPSTLCAAKDAQRLVFDLVGPLALTLTRRDTPVLAERRAAGTAMTVAPDAVADWRIEAVKQIENGWDMTLTQVATGETTVVTMMAKDRVLSLAAWDRTYWRCADDDKPTEASR